MKLKSRNIKGIIFDLGFSYTQIKSSEKGLSFDSIGELNMCLGLNTFSAKDAINKLRRKELELIFKFLGGEKEAKGISIKIDKERKKNKIDTQILVKLIEDFKNYKRFRFSSKNNNDDQLELEIIGMPAPPYWMVEGLTDEEKKEIFKEIKNRINEIYLKPELIGGGPNSIPKLINHYVIINEMYGDYGDYRTIGLKEKFTELAKNINGGMGLIKESNESTDGENHAHND